MDPRPTTIEHGWLLEGRDLDPTYLFQVRLSVTHDGVWRVYQRVCDTNESKTDEFGTEAEARAKLERVYAYGREQAGTRWKITYR